MACTYTATDEHITRHHTRDTHRRDGTDSEHDPPVDVLRHVGQREAEYVADEDADVLGNLGDRDQAAAEPIGEMRPPQLLKHEASDRH